MHFKKNETFFSSEVKKNIKLEISLVNICFVMLWECTKSWHATFFFWFQVMNKLQKSFDFEIPLRGFCSGLSRQLLLLLLFELSLLLLFALLILFALLLLLLLPIEDKRLRFLDDSFFFRESKTDFEQLSES